MRRNTVYSVVFHMLEVAHTTKSSYEFSHKMRALFRLAFSTVILIIATSAVQLPSQSKVFDGQAKKDSSAPVEFERDPEKIELIYMNEVRKSRISKKSDRGEKKDDKVKPENSEKVDNKENPDESTKNVGNEENEEEMDTYICKRMARLQRVPLCVRLFDQPHYRDELKIKFNHLAYRAKKPECVKQELTFRSASMSTYTGVQQEMFPCPGRHHPLRSNWKFDDFKDVFYVSSGAVPVPSTTQPAPEESVAATGGTKTQPHETTAPAKRTTEAETDIALEGVDRPAAAETDYPSEGIRSELAESQLTLETAHAGTETGLGYTAPAYERTESITKRFVPDSVVVYKRELDADTERFIVYDIIEKFELKTLTFAIVTEYDVEEDLQSMNAVSYNNNAVEIEVIYIREMMKPLDPSIPFLQEEDRLSRYDNIANLYESELVTLCWIILDQPQYKDIDFEPRPPPKQMNKVTVVTEQRIIRFQHSVDYNAKSFKQTMYACKPRYRRQSSNPERIQISCGARPNSYFVYKLFDGKGLGTYSIFEFVENLSIVRATVDVTAAAAATVYSPTERNTEEFEKKFIEVIRKRDVKEDIVCKKIHRDQLRALCVRLFQKYHYAKELNIFFNYRLSLRRLEFCQTRKVTIVTAQLQSTTEIHHPMGVCEGRHNILRTDHNLDDYKDLIHIAQGPDANSVVVFRQNNTADSEWFQVYDIVPIGNLLRLEKVSVTLNDIQVEFNQSFIPSYNSNKPEIEIIYIREMFKLAPVADTLAGKPDGVMNALCYKLLDRDPYKELDFEISRVALYTWKTNVHTYQITFVHSDEYNDMHLTQPMYPCYGRHVHYEVGWRKDEYLHQYKISSGRRPNSFFLYALQSTENQQWVYTVHEFVENFESLESLEPREIKYEEVYEDIIRGNSVNLGALRKTVEPSAVENGTPQPDAANDVKPENVKNRPTEPKSAEPQEIVIRNQESVRVHQNESPVAKNIATNSGIPAKMAVENPNPIEIEQLPAEVLKQVIVETPAAQSNLDEPKVKTENEEPITIEPVQVEEPITIEPVQIVEEIKPVNTKNHKTWTSPNESINEAIRSRKPIETKQEEASEVSKQVISEELITRPKPEEPEEDIDNSKLVEQEEIPEELKLANTRGRKKWTITDEPAKMAGEPKAVRGKPDKHVPFKPINSNVPITRLKSRPIKTEVEKPPSKKSELDEVFERRRSPTSKYRVTRSGVSKSVNTDTEKPESDKIRRSTSKQSPSQGFATPEKVKTGRKIKFVDESDSRSVAVF